MKFGILHLSDLHISSDRNQLFSKVELIKSAVNPRITEQLAVILAYTGDIAFSGKAEEYEQAYRFHENLLSALGQLPKVQILGTVGIPGNHDCDFSAAGDARPVLLSSVGSNIESINLEGESIQQLAKVQTNFFTFLQKLSGGHQVDANKRLYWSVALNWMDKRIILQCLNTAVTSRLKEQPGQLYFPVQAVPDEAPDAEYVATLLHHPYGWLEPGNARELRRRVESTSDIVLSGHEHDSDSYLRVSRSGDETNYIEGAALQSSGDTGFNFITVDIAESINQVFSFQWNDDMYEPLASEAHVFTRKKSLLQGRFENAPDFIKYLNSVGTGFSHPDKALTLRDLFVYPELKLANVAAKNITSIHGEQVLQFVSTSEYLQIAGAPTSGKSTLARALYLDLKHEFNLVPLLLQASLFKGTSIEDLEKTVMQSFSQQYRDASHERFMQLARERKVLLIDDWHKLRIAGKARKKMLDGLRNLFGKVVVFSDDITLLQLLADASEDGSASYGEYCEIKQFGYRLRSDLIRKWHNIGTDLGIDDMELTSKISASENLLDTLVRKGTVPSWPIFILSVLQASSLAVEETALYGSYGHLYEALLTRRMADASRKRQTLGQKYTYLSLVAYRLFQTGMSSLSETALREIHRKYELEYQVTENAELLWQELQDAQVLLRSGDDFSFQYKYAYYFFVAKYFQQGMADLKGANALRDQLAYMVRCVHDEDSANILIFYLYLTKDRDLIEKMLGVASRIFYEKQPALLTSDVEFVNRLRSRSPDILLHRNDIDQNRNERRAQMDAGEQSEQENPHAIEKTEYSDTVSDALKIEFAFKSLQVMGQVVKNFPLDLKGDLKVALTKQSYELTLRTLRTYLSLIEVNMTEILDLFDRALRAFQPFSKKSAEEIRDASQAMTVRLTEFAIFGMLKRLSLAVGVPDLKETYYQVRQMASEDDIANRLIDLCIKLDHFGQIPENDVGELEQRLRSNITAYTILKLLVADFLHLFPCNYKVEQRMVQLFKFQPHVTKLTEKRVKRLN